MAETMKAHIQYISEKLDSSNICFNAVLVFYYHFLTSKEFDKKITDSLTKEPLSYFHNELFYIEKNVRGQLSEAEEKERKVSLWTVHDKSSGVFCKLLRLLISGITSKNSMMDYSNYEEYVAGDFLELIVSCVFEMGEEFSSLLIKFTNEYKK